MRSEQSKYRLESDENLVLMMTKGEKKAFDELYERYAESLHRFFVFKLWKNEELAEDKVHDFFTKLIQKPELFNPSKSFKTWAYSVANNMCKNEYRKQEVRQRDEVNQHLGKATLNARELLNEVQENFFREALNDAIEELATKHSEVFRMRHFGALSINEIAEELKLSVGTVKSRLFYATKYLAKKLKQYHPQAN